MAWPSGRGVAVVTDLCPATFVSIMSDNDVPIETIADLVGHRTIIVTQTVYRHQLRPVIETGATAMNSILNRQKDTESA